MANALEAASLVMIPSGYEDGTLGSLKPTDGTGDFTFSRGSNISATRINEQGYIEKGYENLLTYSNTFSDATWGKSSVSVTSGQSGYDGTNDASLLEATSTTAARLQRSTGATGVATLSFFGKAGTTDWVRLNGGNSSVWFDLSNGTIGTLQSYNLIDYSIDSVSGAGGWYRCVIVTDAPSFFRIYPANSDGGVAIIGDSIYIQDAMLNQGLVAYPYIETTTAPVAGGILEDEPRIDFSDGCGHLLLEPSRTNLIPYSEYNFASTNGTIDYNNALSPEGYTNAIKFTSTGTAPHIRIGANQSVSNATISAFVKYGNKQWVQFMLSSVNTLYANFDIQNGVVGDTGASTSNAKIEDYGNGWYRISATFSYIGSTSARIYLVADGSANWASPSSVSGDYIYTYGWQAEQDTTYPTSYIPTYGVSQTRLADKTDRGSNLAYTGNYTLFMEFEYSDSSFQILNQNVATNHNLLIQNDDTYFTFRSTGAQVNFLNTFDWSANSGNNIKMAFYKQGINAKMFVNGTEYTPTTNTLSTGDEVLDWRYLNFSITAGRQEQLKVKQLVEFQTALSDSECIALTTI